MSVGSVLLIPEVLTTPLRIATGADRFPANSRPGSPSVITEIDVVCPEDLPGA